MNRWRTATIALVTVAVLGTLLAAAALGKSISPAVTPFVESQQFYEGFYSPSQSIDVADRSVAGGTYRIGYSMTVLFTPADESTRLVCRLIAPNGDITRFEPDTTKTVEASARPTSIRFSGLYELPHMSIELRCHPTGSGHFRVQFTGVTVETTSLAAG